MAKVDLDPNFREFLKSLNSNRVKYLLIGGYAVNHYGYRRFTDDIDIWIAVDPKNANKVSQSLQQFGGFSPKQVKPRMFLEMGAMFKFGREPFRIDILTSPSGVKFEACYAKRKYVNWDGIKVPLIALDDLRVNKQSSGRAKDLADLDNLPTLISKPVHPLRAHSKTMKYGRE